ncbi:MAG: ACT domain-containing protein [Pseudoxanthomonas sp.]
MAEQAAAMVLRQVSGAFAVCRLPAGSEIPHWFHPGGFASISWTAEELSIVCDEAMVPEEVQCEREWTCLMLQGPFAFHMTGVLLQVLQPLALAKIGIFALSTFDTDYVLVKQHDLEPAKRALREGGLTVLQ